MKVELIEPYGYCIGVANVIKQIQKIASIHHDKKIFCIGQVVHNQKVNDDIRKLNVNILTGEKDSLIDSISSGVVIFSAHGTDEKIINKAKEKGLIVYDLVCPFVKRTFKIINEALKDKKDVIYIGVNNHEESNAALSIDNNIHFVTSVDDINKLKIKNENICVINQTTLSIIDIKDIYTNILNKYPNAEIVDEICNSTRIRQQVLLDKKISSDGIIVVGDKNSNNSKSLYNIALKQGYNTIFVSNEKELDYNWILNKKSISIMSGASSDKAVVEEIYTKLKKINKN